MNKLTYVHVFAKLNYGFRLFIMVKITSVENNCQGLSLAYLQHLLVN